MCDVITVSIQWNLGAGFPSWIPCCFMVMLQHIHFGPHLWLSWSMLVLANTKVWMGPPEIISGEMIWYLMSFDFDFDLV